MSKVVGATDETGVGGTGVLRGEGRGLEGGTLGSFDDDESGAVGLGLVEVGVGLVPGCDEGRLRYGSVWVLGCARAVRIER